VETLTELVSLDEIRAARERVKQAALFTPLLEVPYPGRAGQSLYLKAENLQPMGAFKIRGAFNMLSQLPAESLRRGVVTYSSGNHGQAVALAARKLGAPAVIVMPTTATSVKVEGAKAYGAEVIFEGTNSLHRQARAEREAEERGLTMVPPFDHRMIVAGQGTVGLEILEQMPEVGTVFVPVGGGGLAAGASAALKQSKSAVRVVAVEPEGAPKMSRSLAAGHPITLESSATIADGLMNLRPGTITFKHVQTFVDEVVTVSDEAIAKAIAWLSRNARLVVEPSGAATTAAVMLGLGGVDLSRGPVVAIVSGGNVAPEALAKYLTA
jgi:threo-3-hydroxy-L-aspartate ammonia-lyase